MVIRRVGPLSCAKIGGALYALMGFLVGIGFALMGLVIGASAQEDAPMMGMFGAAFGLGAVIFMPLFYGVLGFVMTLISAFLYNVLAGALGGIQIEVEGGPASIAT